MKKINTGKNFIQIRSQPTVTLDFTLPSTFDGPVLFHHPGVDSPSNSHQLHPPPPQTPPIRDPPSNGERGGSGDRNNASLVSKRWLRIEGQSRHCLTLDAKSELLSHVPSLFARFDAVTKLALRCDRPFRFPLTHIGGGLTMERMVVTGNLIPNDQVRCMEYHGVYRSS
ncbi:hypothetical protein Vadar_008745 [Vaccinium darrowii]|uniref:Uncharacterized protein n=1 Tax=Vaccinium darrowii TaxID=229202 RepID=A0ACB7ZID1_9ERIC|nr:hypothetical protein Vadar_008745 [Vaccinium darrowii]